MTEIDPWHYTGNNNFHGWALGRDFIAQCKSSLPCINLPIKIGPTGYINLTDMVELPQYGWCEDEVGRFVAIIGNKLLFQRMINGDRLMYGVIYDIRSVFSDSVTIELLNQLRDEFSKLFVLSH